MQIRTQGNRYQFIRNEVVDKKTGARRQDVFLSLPTDKMPVEADVVDHLSVQEMIDFEVWRANKLARGEGGTDPLSKVKWAIQAATEAMTAMPPSDEQRAEIEAEIRLLEEEMLRWGYEP
jgi:hypothetical protein